jgi:hypothetical protein
MKFNLAAAAVATTAFSADVLPGANIDDLGYCAQFYLRPNCRADGRDNPYTDSVYYHDDPTQKAQPNAYDYYGDSRPHD